MAPAAVVAVAAAAAGVAVQKQQLGVLPRTASSRGAPLGKCIKKGGRATPLEPTVCGGCAEGRGRSCGAAPGGAAAQEQASNDGDDTDDDDYLNDDGDDDDGDMGDKQENSKSGSAPPKLWSNSQFPEGVVPPAANWDMANLAAAQDWSCPCADRRNCIGAERGVSVLHLYEHRKLFLTTCKSKGGKRDALRAQLAEHFSSADKRLTRSFVVGPLADCCAAAAALACGVSCQTFQNARADLRGNKPLHGVRKKRRADKVSHARSTIDTYIRRKAGTWAHPAAHPSTPMLTMLDPFCMNCQVA
jgi:hypothetical protein